MCIRDRVDAILAAGFHRTPAPAPSDDVRALAGRARDVAKYQTYGDIDNLLRLLADALERIEALKGIMH